MFTDESPLSTLGDRLRFPSVVKLRPNRHRIVAEHPPGETAVPPETGGAPERRSRPRYSVNRKLPTFHTSR